ncbi:hypothetical protein [Pyrobaculum sp.]|uniref:hypothetical protein n=1 Tax=Pyrobaculum sp. TaxID=2004705 RepID=UPI00316A3CAD
MHPCVFMVDPESPHWTTCMAKYVSLEALEEAAGILGLEGVQGLRRYLAQSSILAREVARVLLDVYQRRYGKRAEAMLGSAFVKFAVEGVVRSPPYRFKPAPPCQKYAEQIEAVDVRVGPCVLLQWEPGPHGLGLPDKKLRDWLRGLADWFRWWPPQYKPWRSFNPPQWALEAKEECGLDSIASTSRGGRHLAAWLYWRQYGKPPGLC